MNKKIMGMLVVFKILLSSVRKKVLQGNSDLYLTSSKIMVLWFLLHNILAGTSRFQDHTCTNKHSGKVRSHLGYLGPNVLYVV